MSGFGHLWANRASVQWFSVVSLLALAGGGAGCGGGSRATSANSEWTFRPSDGSPALAFIERIGRSAQVSQDELLGLGILTKTGAFEGASEARLAAGRDLGLVDSAWMPTGQPATAGDLAAVMVRMQDTGTVDAGEAALARVKAAGLLGEGVGVSQPVSGAMALGAMASMSDRIAAGTPMPAGQTLAAQGAGPGGSAMSEPARESFDTISAPAKADAPARAKIEPVKPAMTEGTSAAPAPRAEPLPAAAPAVASPPSVSSPPPAPPPAPPKAAPPPPPAPQPPPAPPSSGGTGWTPGKPVPQPKP